MPTLLFFGPSVDGNRDTYLVSEDLETVSTTLNSGNKFVAFSDTSDGEPV